MVAAAALAACQKPATHQATRSHPTMVPVLKLGSQLADVRIVPTNTLPTNPTRGSVDEYCSSYVVARPKSPGGRLAGKNGWIVTSEAKLGDYDAVTFVGALEPATSATCAHKNGNLAIFDGSLLKAIAYLRPLIQASPVGSGQIVHNSLGVDLAAEDSLGSAEQIDQRRIRLNYGLPSPPFADVVLRDGILIEATAAVDRICDGAAVVPNVFGQDIRTARRSLGAAGWRPVKQASDLEMWGVEKDLFRKGVIEVESCAGTGYGFCAYDYIHPKGLGLRVISMGEGYSVTGYEAVCEHSR